jgi:hypothetical protein
MLWGHASAFLSGFSGSSISDIRLTPPLENSHDSPYEHIILITIDGVRPDILMEANTPYMDNLMANGSFTLNAWTVTPSVTIAAIPSIHTGATPEVHGVTDWNGEIYAETLTEVFEEAGLPCAIVCQSPILGGYSATYSIDYYYHPQADENFMSEAIHMLIRHNPFFMSTYNPMPDRRGHAYGHESPEYKEAIENADYHIGRLIENLKELGVYENTLIVITTDHGMTGQSHGNGYENDMRVFSIWHGPRVKENYRMFDNVYIPPSPTYDETYVAHRIVDIAPTVTSLVGLRAPENSEGSTIYEIFDNLAPPDYVYLTWATSDTAHTINVSWHANENYVGEVRYDDKPHGGDPDAYSYIAVGTGGVTTPEFTGYIHHVELTDLKPNTTYYFISGHPNYGWSSERSFRTAPDGGVSFRFVMGADSRDDNRYDYPQWPSARDSISARMAQYDPSFVIFVGDFLWSSENPPPPGSYAENDTWDNWFRAADLYWRTTDGRMIPLIPVIGNHEIVYPEPSDYDPATDATNYYTVFSLPENERWYALSWGPDLRIIALDGEVLDESSATWQRQLNWLEGELQRSENYLWKVVAFHRPIVSSGWDGWNWHGRLGDWGYLFTKYGVDVVLQAHIHWYERSYPIDSDPPPGEIAPPGEGVIYLVSGGWGGPLSYGSPENYTAYGPESKYHFVLIDVLENGTLHVQAIDQQGNVFDEFSLYKGIPNVKISIFPSENSGPPSTMLNYSITVMNLGTVADNYILTASDNAVPSWAPTLSDNLLENVQPGENRTVVLTVTIPDNTSLGVVNLITVTATSQLDNMVRDNASCIARVMAKVEFSLLTLYKVSLDVNLWLENGSELVVKFCGYDNLTLEGENVFWSDNTPAHVVKFENVPHPLGEPVKIAKLVRRPPEYFITSFTVTQDHLFGRIVNILGQWPDATPTERNALWDEIIDILGQWPDAPP